MKTLAARLHAFRDDLYLWRRPQSDIDASALVALACSAGVSVVSGVAFYPDDGRRHEFRLCVTGRASGVH